MSGPVEHFPDWQREREKDVIRWALERGIVAPIEDPHDFNRHAHVVIWSAVLGLRAEGKSVDYLTVRAALDQRGQLDIVGPVYLSDLAKDSIRPSDAAVLSAAQEIQQAARTRRLRALLAKHAASDQIDLDRLAADLDALQASVVDRPQLLDDAAILNLPGLEYLTAGVPARSLIALIGDSGIGKTFVAADLALSIASGRTWLGAGIQKRGPTVYCAAEGTLGPRVGGWKIAHGFDLDAPVGLHTWVGPVNLLDPAAVSAFIAAAAPVKPVLVALDTLARCMVGGDENSAKDMGLAVAAMDRIRTQLGATVLVLHHMNKAGTSERGSGALRGACDTVLMLQRADDLLQIVCDKQKDAEPFPPISIKLTVAYPGAKTCIVRPAAEVVSDDELTDAQGKALHALVELFGELGATSKEWEDSVPAMHRASYYRARRVLIDSGYVRQDANAKRFYPTSKVPVARCRTAVARNSEVAVA